MSSLPSPQADGSFSLDAKAVWFGPGDLRGPLRLRIAGGRVEAVEELPSASGLDNLLLPGLVNAHVHLALPALDGGARRFDRWVQEVMAARQGLGEVGGARLAEQHAASLLADGVTAVGEIDSTGASPAALQAVPLAGRCYRELTGFHLDAAGAQALLQDAPAVGTAACHPGWSPHAPYSVSPALFGALRDSGQALAVHVAEIAEEVEFLQHGTGPLRSLLEDLGRLPPGWQAPRQGPVQYLDELGLLGPRCQLVHAQLTSAADAARIAARGAPIVICPGTIEYFGRPRPDLHRWLELGIPVALGTDSRASNTGLSLREEMRRLRTWWPDLSAERVLAMATQAGGQALARPGLGRIQPGGAADLLEIECRGSPDRAIEDFTRATQQPRRIWLGGARHGVGKS